MARGRECDECGRIFYEPGRVCSRCSGTASPWAGKVARFIRASVVGVPCAERRRRCRRADREGGRRIASAATDMRFTSRSITPTIPAP